ncbi:hypothetical protein WJX84_006722 [Apatococcus fuscideae]|uniref:Glycosyltransferase family 31 protein n=1 Tax=Apatococcus fuscideae TaxID=2026836 RepID=A0AAW1SNI2_9CHLO
MPSSVSRLPLVQAGRFWREGVTTFVALERNWTSIKESEFPPGFKEGLKKPGCKEVYGQFQDLEHNDPKWHKAGDIRAAAAPFLGNFTVGSQNYKWLIFGDDDTVFLIDNVLKLVNEMDHKIPYFMTDHIWFPEREAVDWGEKDVYVHANRKAPRCLPCDYRDPLENTTDIWGWNAISGCPCSTDVLCKSDNLHIFWEDCSWVYWTPGYWYFLHGGAGAIISNSLMDKRPYQVVADHIVNRDYYGSGDSILTETMWHQFGVHPTDPGYGYFRKHIRMFDPGWQGAQVKGIEDEDTQDHGNDPVGVIERLHKAFRGECDAECDDQLQHIITVHIRSRYADREVDNATISKAVAQDETMRLMPEEHRPAAWFHYAIGNLYLEYTKARGPMNLWGPIGTDASSRKILARQANIPDIPFPTKPPAPPPPIVSSKTASESLTMGFTGDEGDEAGEWWTSSGSAAISSSKAVSATDLPEEAISASEVEELAAEEIQADLQAEKEQAAILSSSL